jgi:PadR family transcriptional regulator AphA
MGAFPLTVEYALLGFLREGPLHGYAIYRQLSDPDKIGLVWQLKRSQLYALLAKLEDEGHLTSVLEPQAARPPRKVFELTESGRQAFFDWVQSPVLHGREIRLTFLVKLYFAQREGPEVAAGLVERQRNVCQGWLDMHRARSHTARSSQPYKWLVHQFRIGQIEAVMNWLNDCQNVATAVDSATWVRN